MKIKVKIFKEIDEFTIYCNEHLGGHLALHYWNNFISQLDWEPCRIIYLYDPMNNDSLAKNNDSISAWIKDTCEGKVVSPFFNYWLFSSELDATLFYLRFA